MNFLRCASNSDGGSSSSSGLIKEGDCVIVYEGINAMKAVYITAKGRFESRFGAFDFKSWIGKPFGSKVTTSNGSGGWVMLLRPNPELWTQVLRHRTQILYLADISMVVAHLDLQPGRVVLESGTGSGSLTHSLVRAVAPRGHVHTFEFHAGRAEDAAAEFKQHGLSGLVTVTQRNIEELGFLESLHGAADAVFLDLPAPYKVVPSAAACLKPNGRFCAFSPCIEQVQRTAEALSSAGFTDLITYECLLREYDVFRGHVYTGVDLEGPQTKRPRTDLPVAPPRLEAAEPKVVEVKIKAEAELAEAVAAPIIATGGWAAPEAMELAAPNATGAGDGDGASSAGEMKEEGAGTSGRVGEDQPQAGTAAAEVDPRKPDKQQQQGAGQQGAGQQGGGQQKRRGPLGAGKLVVPTAIRMVHCQPAREGRGHTGYLTFARKFVCG